MKKCNECQENKRSSEYYALKANSDGLFGKCKECVKARVRKNRRDNPEKHREADRKRSSSPYAIACRAYYAQTKEGKEAGRRAKNKWADNNKGKRLAMGRASYAINAGKIKKGNCEDCGKKKVHAHHDDYSKPLDIRWLCSKCHTAWHRINGEGKNANN